MTNPLSGLNVLIVEDVLLVADEVAHMNQSLGCNPLGPVARVDQALDIIRNTSHLDGVLLDVNLGADTGYPIAEELQERGIPYIFMTGYDSNYLAEGYRGSANMQKPFTIEELQRIMAQVFASQPAGRTR